MRSDLDILILAAGLAYLNRPEEYGNLSKQYAPSMQLPFGWKHAETYSNVCGGVEVLTGDPGVQRCDTNAGAVDTHGFPFDQYRITTGSFGETDLYHNVAAQILDYICVLLIPLLLLLGINKAVSLGRKNGK